MHGAHNLMENILDMKNLLCVNENRHKNVTAKSLSIFLIPEEEEEDDDDETKKETRFEAIIIHTHTPNVVVGVRTTTNYMASPACMLFGLNFEEITYVNERVCSIDRARRKSIHNNVDT